MFLLLKPKKYARKHQETLEGDVVPEILLNEEINASKKLLSTRKRQINTLYTILHLSLLRGNFLHAKYAFSILIRCREVRLYDIWDIGLEILRHFDINQQETYLKHLIVLYQPQTYSSFSKKDLLSTQEFLRALVLLYIEKGEFKKLLDVLEEYLLSAPYSENAVFYQYAGMAALELSKKTFVSAERKQFYEKAEHLFQKAKEKGGSILYINDFSVSSSEESTESDD
ncbi:hypothetical protein PORY_000510 [Pneumocystis oryctolagi]|uniref:Uncharacterized protein n=1 Tax=Pneumocystis oryctolagi TaxID=42067 RepID=A0ACB7CHT0_9ASCO|nr:hypothetical protein PORY_000510 [Pneumocystis oryctolagi]